MSSAPRRWPGALLLAAALAFVVLKYLGTVNHWKLTHWLFGYELGLIKRGLVGTLVSAAAPDGVVRAAWVVALALAAAALFTASLAALAWPAFADLRRRRAVALGLCALAAPGAGFLLSDLGRFDVVSYAPCLLALAAARATGRLPYPLFLALGALALLIHEAALLLALPVAFVAQLDAAGRLAWLARPRRWPRLAARLAPLVLLCAWLALAGGAELSLRELIPRLAARADFRPSASSAFVLVRGLDSNVAQILGAERRVTDLDGAPGPPLGGVALASFAAILPVALAQLALAHVLLRALPPGRRRPALAALHLCFLAPFPLLLLGVDWGRWAALASMHCAALSLYFAPELPAGREAPLPLGTALVAGLFVLAASAAPYPMEGARGGRAESPVANVQRWLHQARQSPSWYGTFVTP